ncbi:MAG: YbfB/YjiJ family MFS transporter [Alphaproteobacteria bacterium]|nr:YbfB/YjiJ family MFS transporter [Alphaproteobacteria bacterium]
MSDTGATNWRRVALGGAGGMFLGMGVGRFSYTAMLPAIIESGQLTEFEAGIVGGLNLAGFLVGAFFTEMLRRAMPIRVLLGLAVWLSFLALACSALPWGFQWLAVWRGLLGITTAVIMVQSLALATAAAPAGQRATATSFIFAGVGMGIFLSGSLIPWLLDFGLAGAWGGVAAVGLLGAVLAQWGYGAAEDGAPDAPATTSAASDGWPWRKLVAAHCLFSFGIVPHTIYWVDFITRELGKGIEVGGLHWSVVGVFAFVGPWFTAWLARRIGTGWALVAAFVGLTAGIAGPALATAAVVLFASSVLFGAQPGVSTVMAARARDMGTAAAMPRMMRTTILANATAAAVGGLLIPSIFEATGSYDLLFLIGGGAMAAGAVLCVPRGAAKTISTG